MFKEGDKIAIGASGGKDSTVVVHVMNKLNKKLENSHSNWESGTKNILSCRNNIRKDNI